MSLITTPNLQISSASEKFCDYAFSFTPWKALEGNSALVVVGKIALTFITYLINILLLFTVAIAITINTTKKLQPAPAPAPAPALAPAPAATKINSRVRIFLQKRKFTCKTTITKYCAGVERVSLTEVLKSKMENITWFSGSTSTALPLIMRTGGVPQLKATGLLLRENSFAPLCGELSIGSMEHGINNRGLSGVSPNHYLSAIRYSNLFLKPVTDLVEEMEVLQKEKCFNLANKLLIPMFRVICLSNDKRQKDVVRNKLEAMKKTLPAENYEELLGKPIDTRSLLPFSVGTMNQLVAVKRSSGEWTLGAIEAIAADSSSISVLLGKGLYKEIQKESFFSMLKNVAEDTYKKEIDAYLLAYQEKLQALIDLLDRPALYNSFQPTEKMDLLYPYPIVWATTTQEKFGRVRSDIKGESIINEKILIGNGGIDFAFTQAEHVHRLRYALKNIKGVTVLSLDDLSKTHNEQSTHKIEEMYFERMEAVRIREQQEYLADHYRRMAARTKGAQ